MIRRPPRSTRVRSSAASDVYKRQGIDGRPEEVDHIRNAVPSHESAVAACSDVAHVRCIRLKYNAVRRHDSLDSDLFGIRAIVMDVVMNAQYAQHVIHVAGPVRAASGYRKRRLHIT